MTGFEPAFAAFTGLCNIRYTTFTIVAVLSPCGARDELCQTTSLLCKVPFGFERSVILSPTLTDQAGQLTQHTMHRLGFEPRSYWLRASCNSRYTNGAYTP